MTNFDIKDGYIYFVHDKNNFTLFKIGESKNPENKLKILQKTHWLSLCIYKTIHTKDCIKIVKALHKRFESKHILDGWFKISENEIDRVCKEIMWITIIST